MNERQTNTGKDEPRAGHGSSTEVIWNGGQGRQPYANQGEKESGPPAASEEFLAGDRGPVSGTTKEQAAEGKGTP